MLLYAILSKARSALELYYLIYFLEKYINIILRNSFLRYKIMVLLLKN